MSRASEGANCVHPVTWGAQGTKEKGSNEVGYLQLRKRKQHKKKSQLVIKSI